jgi:hypothetical protein
MIETEQALWIDAPPGTLPSVLSRMPGYRRVRMRFSSFYSEHRVNISLMYSLFRSLNASAKSAVQVGIIFW